MNPKLMTFLNPKTVNFDGSGGGGDLTVSDFNAACSGADEIGLELLRRKFGGVRTKTNFGKLFDDILKVAKFWKIRGDREVKLRKLMDLAIFEDNSLPTCRYCKGRKERTIQKKVCECYQCRGTGFYRLKKVDKARHLGITMEGWYVWEARLSEVKMLLDDRKHSAMRSIDKRMRD